jgi:CheY-like chemotaxis protein
MNILIVDDSRFLRQANERALARAGHSVVGASDGEEGLRLAKQSSPDLVVLDMMLPCLSGPDVLHGLRKDPETAEIPVMVLTALPQCNEERLCNEGATAYFQKSLLKMDSHSEPFVEAVEHILKQAAKGKGSWG